LKSTVAVARLLMAIETERASVVPGTEYPRPFVPIVESSKNSTVEPESKYEAPL
jgi:hypothetical protein